MGDKINGQLVQDAIHMAIQQRGVTDPVLVHSNQGSQYTAASYQTLLKQHGLTYCMSRKGECHDNAVAESFFHSLKSELIHDQQYRTRTEAKQSIFQYIELFYNRQRRHSYINYQAPFVYETINLSA